MIDEIHQAAQMELAKREIRPYSSRMDFQKMLRWAESVAKREQLDLAEFERYVKEIFWGLSSLDLNLGYTLLSLKETSYPSGKTGSSNTPKKIDRDFSLADIHYWYHISNCWESIYRIWERIVSVLRIRITPNLRKKLYFDGFSHLILEREIIFKAEANELKRFNKSWNKIAFIRNQISHGTFNPVNNFKIELTNAELKASGEISYIANYEFPNLKQEVQTAINYAEKSVDLINVAIKICDLEIRPRRTIIHI